jgi:mRNA interferase MazF
LGDLMSVHEGDVYWLYHEALDDQPRIAHPQVVVDVAGDRVTVCALTTNMRKVSMPGNVMLDVGEGGLSKRSIVEVSKTAAVPVSRLGEYVGAVSARRVEQIRAGMRFVEKSFRD